MFKHRLIASKIRHESHSCTRFRISQRRITVLVNCSCSTKKPSEICSLDFCLFISPISVSFTEKLLSKSRLNVTYAVPYRRKIVLVR